MRLKEFIGIAILTLFFVLGIFLAHNFDSYITKYLSFGVLGMIIYVLSLVLATVVAPISAVPLIPIAGVLWGPLITALLSIFAWTVGSVIAFLIARYLGKPIVSRMINLETIHKYESALGNEYLFWDVVVLRMALPVDILSYAIGLFSSMKISNYVLATVIGVTPFAFILSFALQGSIFLQITSAFLITISVYFGYRKINNLKKI